MTDRGGQPSLEDDLDDYQRSKIGSRPAPALKLPLQGNNEGKPADGNLPSSNRDGRDDPAKSEKPAPEESSADPFIEEKEKVGYDHKKMDKFLKEMLTFEKPGIINESERLDYEEKHMTRIKTTGFFKIKAAEADKSFINAGSYGITKVDPNSMENLDKNNLMRLDGIYLTRADKELHTDNIRRLEQRLSNSKQSSYFNWDNKELRLENQLFEAKQFRRTDISLVKNSFHTLIKRNAVICERLNQKKKTYYQIEIFVGKLLIDSHPMFGEEDKLASKLKNQMRTYKEKIDKGLIPHYGEVLQEQSKASDSLKQQDINKIGDLTLIHKQIEETKAKLSKEKSELNDCMQNLYSTWKQLKDLRIRQGYISTPIDLRVQEYKSDQDKEEQLMYLVTCNTNEKMGSNNKPIPSSELSRRAKIAKQSYYLKIYINNELMASTPKVEIKWPELEVNFKELFQVFIFTKPYSISVEVCQGGLFGSVLDRIEIPIPGEHANSLTSASTIHRTVVYTKKKIRNLPKKKAKEPAKKSKADAIPDKDTPGYSPADDQQSDLVKQADGGNILVSPDQKIDSKEDPVSTEILDAETEDSEQQIVEVLESGRISLEVGWKGFGPKLPPLNTGGFGIFRQKKKEKQGYQALGQTEEDIMKEEVLIDINDPRNNEYVEKVREIRNNELRSLLTYDMKMPLHDVRSLRHEILRINLEDSNPLKSKIPLLEREVAVNRDIRNRLIKHYDEYSNLMNENKAFVGTQRTDLKVTSKVGGFPYSHDSMKRITQTKQILMKKQNEIRQRKNPESQDVAILSSVIEEFRFGDEENNLMAKILKIFEPRRKLRPQINKPKKKAPSEENKCVITTQAIKGKNIPAREKDPNRQQYDGENALIIDDRFDFPSTYVQMEIVDPELKKNHLDLDDAYEELVVVGETFDGTDPEWNQNLQLTYKTTKPKFNTKDLLENRGFLYISVFDNVGIMESNKFSPTTITLEIEKRFLGNVKIPLSSLFLNAKIDAMFKVNRPIYLAGYKSTDNDLADEHLKSFIDPSMPTYVMLSLGCEPHFSLPENNSTNYYPGNEPAPLLLAGKTFLEAIYKDKENKGRNIKLWGTNIKGQSVFLPRYLTPAEPPKDFFTTDPYLNGSVVNSLEPEGNGKAVIDDTLYQKCARFVSLIPFKNESNFFRDMPDIFMTSQEFLDMQAGDFEEHAIMLCNYFLYIDKSLKKTDHIETAVVMGRAVPEGKSYYVLRRDTDKDIDELWNPITGDIYRMDHKKHFSKFLCFKISSGETVESTGRSKSKQTCSQFVH